MRTSDLQRIEKAAEKYEAGDRTEAVQDLREVIETVYDSRDKVWLLSHEITSLIELHRVSQARQSLDELKGILAVACNQSPDADETEADAALVGVAAIAEAKVLLEEGDEIRELAVLDAVCRRYAKQLSQPNLRRIFDYIQLLRAFTFANFGRWDEAKPLLENSYPPEDHRSMVSYYLGYCHYHAKHYSQAKTALLEALKLGGLSPKLEGGAHYVLALSHYHLLELQAAKMQFELCAKTANADYLLQVPIWEWLETVCRELGLKSEAARYRQRMTVNRGPKPS